MLASVSKPPHSRPYSAAATNAAAIAPAEEPPTLRNRYRRARCVAARGYTTPLVMPPFITMSHSRRCSSWPLTCHRLDRYNVDSSRLPTTLQPACREYCRGVDHSDANRGGTSASRSAIAATTPTPSDSGGDGGDAGLHQPRSSPSVSAGPGRENQPLIRAAAIAAVGQRTAPPRPFSPRGAPPGVRQRAEKPFASLWRTAV